MHAEGGCTSIRRIGGGDRGVISSFFGGRTYFIKSWQFNFFVITPKLHISDCFISSNHMLLHMAVMCKLCMKALAMGFRSSTKDLWQVLLAGQY
jgi:hypothetical protein